MVSLTDKFPGGFKASEPKKSAYVTITDPRMGFLDHLRELGYVPPTFLKKDAINRFPGPGDKATGDSGWAVYYEFPDAFNVGGKIGVGKYGSWRAGTNETWVSKRAESMSHEERAALAGHMEEAQRLREEAQERLHAETAVMAQSEWASLEPATAHPYLDAKRIKPHGARIKGGALVIPVCDAGGIVSLQYIWPDKKRFMTGGKTRGCYYVIPGTDGTVYVCEGFATGATIAEATGATVYVAFNAGNLIDVTQTVKAAHPGARLIVAGDDDVNTEGNPGRAKATAAADMAGCDVAFPAVPTDFNDMACAGHDVAVALAPAAIVTADRPKEKSPMPPDLLKPPGMLGDIVSYYNATARRHEGGYAVQAALALASVVCGRNFRTDKENFSAMYFLNVGKSSSGKEHGMKVCERCLEAAGQHEVMIGGGYTSSGAVYSTLLRLPRHLAVIDEFGMYLESAGNAKNTNLMEANKELMGMIGRTDGIARPQAYSTMTLTKERADEMAERKVYNPSITMLAMTTPSKLYENLSSKNVHDGFLGRFVIYQSDAERDIGRMRTIIDVPQRIVEWIKAVTSRASRKNEIASERPEFVTVPFSRESEALHTEFDRFCVTLCNELERNRLEELPGRSNEMAMKLALIVALARDPYTNEIKPQDSEWAISYIKFCLLQTVEIFKMKVSGSQYEAEKKAILEAIKAYGAEGITLGAMHRTPPFSYPKKRDLTEILDALCESGLVIYDDPPANGKPGRPSQKMRRYWHKSFVVAVNDDGADSVDGKEEKE
jgi:phage/plasmid primase-like uncharacterized protein